jgi:hypothetical protein
MTGTASALGHDDLPHSRVVIARPALQRELLRRRDAAQVARASLVDKGLAVIEQSIAVDDDNTIWLRSVVEEMGWPGRSLVGDEGAEAAWLLAQHADRDPWFQRRCLALLTRAATEGDASPRDVAHLTDRIRLAEGEFQVYGTQLNARDGRYQAPRLCDPGCVDERRATVGLGTLAEHIAQALQHFGPPIPAQSRCLKCKAPIEVWLPELGGNAAVDCGSCGFKMTVRARIRASAQDPPNS